MSRDAVLTYTNLTMVFVFSLTLFVSSCLMFLVEPMFAKMVLPLLGGAPSVWNTCMLFFQAVLLAGYAYAHLVIARLRPPSQIPTHLLVMLVPLVVLPVRIGADWRPPTVQNPVPWLVLLMLASVGLPFFAVSTTVSVIQKWFSQSGHKLVGDPYFLYVASNAGGIAGLIGYLIVVEPNLTLAQQSRVWSLGYGVLILLSVVCAAFLAKHNMRRAEGGPSIRFAAQDFRATEVGDAGSDTVPIARQLRWVALAFAPSSLMLSVTTFLSTAISPVPLLWVIPLTIYLLTFMIAFSRRSAAPRRLAVRLLPIIVLVVTMLLFRMTVATELLMLSHLFMFFLAGLACHGQLAMDRPPPARLTGYYLLIAAGGALGGVFTVIVAPLVFKSVTEYTVVLVLACMLCRNEKQTDQTPPAFNRFDLLIPVGLGILTAGMLYGALAIGHGGAKAIMLILAFAAVLCYRLVTRPIRFGLGLGAILLVSSLLCAGPRPEYRERTFFGILVVTTDQARQMRVLMNGNIKHGMQSLVPEERQTPLAYYYPTGPIGQVFGYLSDKGGKKNFAMIGLGAGALAGYAVRGQVFTFYDIDPAVARVASDTRYFTYLADARSRGADVRVVLGDGRLSIARVPDASFDLIVIDAFNSDSIPTHLLTREAMRIYLSKLRADGLIAVHTSNAFVDISSVIGELAADAGLVCLKQIDQNVSAEEDSRGKLGSDWVIVARRESDLAGLRRNPAWQPVPVRPGSRVWTDDYSNILQVFKW